MPVVVSTHPRTRNRLEALGNRALDDRVRWMTPFGFNDYNKLQKLAFCAISDSGTIAEESSILGFPAVTPRDSIERPEALDVGCIILTGLNREAITGAVDLATRIFAQREAAGSAQSIPSDYCVTNTSERVVSLILGTARLSNEWDGIRTNDITRLQ